MNQASLDLGPLLLGIVLNSLLSGIFLAPHLFRCLVPDVVGLHVHSAIGEPIWVKNCIKFVFFLDVLESIVCVRMLYEYYSVFLENAIPIAVTSLSASIYPILLGTLSCAVQLYFGHWVYELWQSLYLMMLIAAVSLFQCAVSFVIAAARIDVVWFIKWESTERLLVFTWLLLAVFVNVLIITSFVSYQRSNETSEENHFISKLIREVIQMSVIPMVWSVIHLVCFAVMRNNVHAFFVFVYAKMYTIPFYVLLHARRRWGVEQPDLAFPSEYRTSIAKLGRTMGQISRMPTFSNASGPNK